MYNYKNKVLACFQTRPKLDNKEDDGTFESCEETNGMHLVTTACRLVK